MNSIHLTYAMTEEILDVYRGIYPDYHLMVEHIASGSCIAVMVTPRDNNDDNKHIVTQFREFAGPLNPELAKVLRPTSIRANFGNNMINNAVHCTDLPEDGILECKYIFQLLAAL